MAIVKTEIVVPSQDARYSVPGNFTPDYIKQAYATDFPGIGQMSVTEAIETRVEGEVKVLTFKPKVGEKG